MAELKRTKLVLRFNIGTEKSRSTKTSLSHASPEEATDDAVKIVGTALAGLYENTIADVIRVNEVSLGH